MLAYIVAGVIVILLVLLMYSSLLSKDNNADPLGLWVIDPEKTMEKIKVSTLPEGVTADALINGIRASNMKLLIDRVNNQYVILPVQNNKISHSVNISVKRNANTTEISNEKDPLIFVIANNIMDGRVREVKFLVFKRGTNEELKAIQR